MDAIWIPGNVPSFKNSKQITILPMKYGTPHVSSMLFKMKKDGSFYPVNVGLTSSKVVHRYVKATKWDYPAGKVRFKKKLEGLTPPYRIAFKFVRGTRRVFDYNNLGQGVQDLMVKNGWIGEDDCVHMKPFYMDPAYDKENPGVWIGVF